MKKKIFINLSVLFFISLTFSSCEKIKDLTDVDFDASLKADIPVTSAAAGMNDLKTTDATYPFGGSAVIDPASNSDIKKYWKKIRKWEVKKITVKINSISEPATLVHGKLTVLDNSTEAILIKKDAENMSLSGGTVILTITGSNWNELINALDAKHLLIVEVSGALDKPSVNVTFRVILDLKITANALE